MAEVIIVPEGPHSPLGPSGAKRWMNCAGSVHATRDLPNEQSVYAANGSASHYLSELCRNHGYGAEKHAGAILRVGKYDCPADPARIDSVNRFLEYVYDIGGEQFVELLVRYTHYVTDGFGTSDHIAVVADTLHVVDFKDGEGVQVWAKRCEQLMLYALGWLQEYGWLYPEVKKVVLHIAQPRLNHFDKWDTTVEDVLAFGAEARAAEQLAESPNAPFVPGEWCSNNFCKIRATCEARIEHAAKTALDNFEGFDNLDIFNPPKPKDVYVLTGEALAKAYDLSKLIAKWCSEVKVHVMGELMHGHEVGGKKLVQGKSNRVWAADPDTVVETISEHSVAEGFCTDQLYTTPELKSVSQIEALVGKELFQAEKPAGKTARAAAKPEGPLFKLVKKVPCAPTIADADDPRPAVQPSAMEEFANLDANEDDPFNLLN